MSNEIQKHSVAEIQVIASEAASSGMFGLTKPQAFTLALLAQAQGLHPVEAFMTYHVVEGRPSMKADAIQARFQAAGGVVEWKRSDGKEATAIFRHPKQAPDGFAVSVTLQELMDSGVAMTGAKDGRPGYLKKMYKQYPAQMLRARCAIQGVRAVLPGVILGIYTPEEISDFDSRETPIETTARVVEQPKPAPARVEARKVADDLVGQLNGPRVQERHQSALTTAAELKTAPKLDTTPRPDLRPYTAVITEACRQVNAQLDEWCEEKGIEHSPVLNVHQVENHMATQAVKDDERNEKLICNEKGIRTRGRVTAFLANWFDTQEADFTGIVKHYCADKLKEACTLYGILYSASGEMGDGEPEVDAEDESQDTGDDEEAIEAD